MLSIFTKFWRAFFFFFFIFAENPIPNCKIGGNISQLNVFSLDFTKKRKERKLQIPSFRDKQAIKALCMLSNFACFSVVRLVGFFSNSTFLGNSFKSTIRMSSSLDPDQARHFVGPDLDPNCLQR